MLVQFHPECQDKIQNNGRAESHESGVDEVFPDAAGRKIELFPQFRTNSKYLVFNEIPKLVHSSVSIIAS